uniref:post-GPI attachment to proteins factor 2 n=1 Tax=Doryrhamphus excisus TaxID=161450 RepID=UPI0025AE4919|nr:post-GPI attachment to proteins factor 2 [Doryrhamphus excisus]
MLHGPYRSLDGDRPLFQIPYTTFTIGTLVLPISGLVVSLFVALIYHFEDAIYTHCHVSNYLPSISAAISRVPERYIWRCCIGLHSAPRLLMAASYFSFYRRRFADKLPELVLSGMALLCSLTENSALLLLTFVASTEDYNVHKNCFFVFIVSSLLHMLITCRLWHVINRHYVSPEEGKSYRWKLRLFLFNLSSCVAAAYFFRRHNQHCEAGVYTLFAFCEYLVVFSNIVFHGTVYWDFGNQTVMVATPPEDKRY